MRNADGAAQSTPSPIGLNRRAAADHAQHDVHTLLAAELDARKKDLGQTDGTFTAALRRGHMKIAVLDEPATALTIQHSASIRREASTVAAIIVGVVDIEPRLLLSLVSQRRPNTR